MKKGYKDIPPAGLITEPGNAESYNTGEWRTFRPVRDESKCIHCLLCWVFCPDSSVKVKDGKMTGFDLMHCKGCGICANECPVKCIEMRNEEQFREKGD